MSEIQNISFVAEYQGELRVSSEVIAERTGVQHKNVLELVSTHYANLEQFGHLAFETRPGYNGSIVRVAHLNEQQGTLLMTFMKNTAPVVEFKLELVKQFYTMRAALTAPKSLAERSLELMGELTAEVQRQREELVEIRPLATQARTFNKRKGNTGRQEFARSVVSWALGEGYKVTANQVHEFVGVKLDLFVFGKYRTDRGIATLSGVRRGLTDTDKGVDPRNGHSYEQGFYTPKGVEYAWSRIENYVREHGHLELPQKGISA